jgi:hypothetical protein
MLTESKIKDEILNNKAARNNGLFPKLFIQNIAY